jgi:hypothetical protein
LKPSAYAPDGKIEMARAFERRGAAFSDHVLISREKLLEKIKSGKKCVTGQRKEFLAGTFETEKTYKLAEIHHNRPPTPKKTFSKTSPFSNIKWHGEAGMKIIDKTPFRRGWQHQLSRSHKATLKYGFSWYDRIKTQDEIIPMLEKHLGRSFILMRNVTLGGTDVELPMILIGPPVVLVINVITDQGVFRAKEDEWGKIKGDQICPLVATSSSRTARMGQVLQVFLDRAGLKGHDLPSNQSCFRRKPGTHIESVRPIVRMVMSDALERFRRLADPGARRLSPEMTQRLRRSS